MISTTMKRVYTVDDIRDRLSPIFNKNGVHKAILFGSYATGVATEESDVDIVAYMDSDIDILDFCAMSVDVEDALSKKVDFILGEDVVIGGRIDLVLRSEGVVLFEKVR